MHQCHNIAIFGTKSGRAQYGKHHRDRKDGKGKRDGKDGEDERNSESHWRKKVISMVRKNCGFEISVYYYIIYKC